VSKRRLGAFTLVELLVVIAIIGVLVALLLPAIQAAREAARRSSCQNNMRQLGVAMLNYYSTHKVYPPNSPWCCPPAVQPADRKGSMLVKLLPYLEETTLSDRLDFKGDIIGQFEDKKNSDLRQAVLKVLRCPSDDFPLLSDEPTYDPPGHAVTNYAPSVGAQTTFSAKNNKACPEYPGNIFGTVQLPHAATHERNMTSGIFSRQGWAATIQQIEDGTSHTIAMGEVLPNCNYEFIRMGWWDSWVMYVCTTPPINYNSCRQTDPVFPHPADAGCDTNFNYNTSAGFKSKHPGGANFTLADASVQFITENIDYRNYQRLGERRDGEAVEPY
jgi:prepilin-type N-terminal cleavage/methylation domain-containing protein